MRSKRIALGLLAVAVLAPTASAHERVTLDQDDSAGPLDIVATQLTHADSRLKLQVITYETWTDATLSDDWNFVRFDLDRPNKPGVSRCLLVRLHPPAPPDEGPVGVTVNAYRQCDRPPPYYGEVEATTSVVRSDQHSLTLYVDKDFLWKRPLRNLRFRAITSYEDPDHPECEPPEQLPPEKYFGTCSDATRWRRH